MLNKEDLMALSDLLDVKLEPIKSGIAELKEDVKDLKQRMGNLEEEIRELKQRVGVLEEDVRVLKEDVRVLKEDVRVLKEDVRGLKQEVRSLKGKVSGLEQRTGKLETDMHHVRLLLENSIEPRLQNIENCYLSTYKRYSDGAEQIEDLQADVKLLKGIAAEHGEQIRRLAEAM